MRRALPLFAALALLRAVSASAVSACPAPTAAKRYVRPAFADNLALRAPALDGGAARACANGARQPRFDLLARYARADRAQRPPSRSSPAPLSSPPKPSAPPAPTAPAPWNRAPPL